MNEKIDWRRKLTSRKFWLTSINNLILDILQFLPSEKDLRMPETPQTIKWGNDYGALYFELWRR